MSWALYFGQQSDLVAAVVAVVLLVVLLRLWMR